MAMRKSNVILYGRIQARFKELFNGQKLRYDKVTGMLCTEFCKAENTIYNILRMDLPPSETTPKEPPKDGS